MKREARESALKSTPNRLVLRISGSSPFFPTHSLRCNAGYSDLPFLSEIERVVPWQKLLDVISPHYRKGGKTGRPPIPLERLLQMCLAQQCFALSDEGTEDALYGNQSIRSFLKDRLMMKNTRYRCLKKNTAQLFTLFGLANLLIAKRKLFAHEEGGAS